VGTPSRDSCFKATFVAAPMPFRNPAVPFGEAQPATRVDLGPVPNDDLPDTSLKGRRSGKSAPCTAASKRRGRPISTIVIHPNELLRVGLARILAETQFRVRTQCSSFERLPRRALAGQQSLALIGIDHSNPGAALSEIPYLKSQGSQVHVIVLGERLGARMLVSLIEAGADGYLLVSETTAETLQRCLEVVVLGGVVIPRGSMSIREEEPPFPYDAADLIHNAAPGVPVPVPMPISMQEPWQCGEPARLSNREQAILKELTQGASNKHIARSLGIAEATIKVHVKSLLRKLRVSNRTQAAIWATSHFPTNAPTEISDQKSTRIEISPGDCDTIVERRLVDADDDQPATGQHPSTNHNGESLALHASPGSRVNGGESYRGLINPAIATPRLEIVSPLVTEVVRYLRQQDDVVVPEGNGIFLVNGRFRLETSELIDKANRIRSRQNEPLFN
jgi:two-component system, NarL family, nitrate/nitrite response regulator NarL